MKATDDRDRLVDAIAMVLASYHSKWLRARFPSRMFIVRDLAAGTYR